MSEPVASEVDLAFMREALALAERAEDAGEWPVGAVVVCDGEVIGRGHNAQTLDHDPTAHAEVVAIRDACSRRRQRKLSGCVLYTTLEPCPMCEGAIVEADLARVVFGGELFAWIRDVKFAPAAIDRQGPIETEGRAIFERRLRRKGRDEVFAYEQESRRRRT